MRWLRRLCRGFPLFLSLAVGMTAAGREQAGAPLTLEDAISSARVHHPLLASAYAAEEQARSARKAAVSARLPTITVAEDALYSNDPVFAFGSKLRQARFSSNDFDLHALNHPAALSNFTASATANWTAFDGGARRNQIASANSSVLAAQLQSRYAVEQVTASVTRLFYRVLMAEDQIAVTEAALKRARELAADVGDRVQAGLSLESDGARAQLALQDAENDAAAAEDNLRLARDDFFETIGEPQRDRPLQRPAAGLLPREGAAPGSGSAKRLDVLALGMEQQSARELLSSIKATAWPQISTWGHVENDAEYVAANGSGNWALGAKIQMNVFDGGLRKAREQAVLATFDRLAAQQRATLLEAATNIGALNTRIADLQRRMTTATSAVQVEEAGLQTARDRYAGGLVSITEVLRGESDLSAAEFARVRTFYQLRIADADLSLAAGEQTMVKAGQR